MPDSTFSPAKRPLVTPASAHSRKKPTTHATLENVGNGQEPTPRQRAYVAGVLAGKSKRRAALDAGYTESSARNPRANIESKPGVQRLFTNLMEKAGVSDELLAQRVYQGLFAMEIKFAILEGKITDKCSVVAFAERRAMLELALRLKGYLTERHEVGASRSLEEILGESWADNAPCDDSSEDFVR